MSSRLEVAIVAGLSGAGKSTVAKALEDLGYYGVASVPPSVVPVTLATLGDANLRKVALVIDAHAAAFVESFEPLIRQLEASAAHSLTFLFLDATEEVLVQRFQGSRRIHPMHGRGGKSAPTSLRDAIQEERRLLAPLRAIAKWHIDTTALNVHQLRGQIVREFAPREGKKGPRLLTRIVSFGFKYGVPTDADMIFDVRFLDNPHFVSHLRDRVGTDPEVRSAVLQADGCGEFMKHVEGLLEFCLPRFELEGKSYITIGIGCTGGRHRSVAVTEELLKKVRLLWPGACNTWHRDVNRTFEGEP